MRRLFMFGGLFLFVCGVLFIFMLYGFGTMMDPDIRGTAREIAIWTAVVRQREFPVAILMIAVGGWLMFHDPRARKGAQGD